MTDNVVRGEVQRKDDPFGIPACFYWTMDEVADWVDSIGYGKYKENFRAHFINGRKLLTVDACVLPRMGITHFGDILDLAKIIECLGNTRIPINEEVHIKSPQVPLRVRELCKQKLAEGYIPWWEQPRHVTVHDYVNGLSRIQASRLANQPQYFMGP